MKERFVIEFPKIANEVISEDGTYKWIFELDDGNCIETVFIPEKNRGTLCISSQVGCPLNCGFCATATLGFKRNLSLSEIIGQLWQVRSRLSGFEESRRVITNVVMMGMGEPLLNLKNVLDALDLIMNDNAFGLSKYRVTVSTIGIIPEMIKLKESDVSLAVSLHAPNDKLRNALMPATVKYPLLDLISFCKNYFERRRYVTFEYIMIKDTNDNLDCAKQLVSLLKGVRCKVNLIPFNPFEGSLYKRSCDENIKIFADTLESANINVIVRRTRGSDIDASCGQLCLKRNQQRYYK